MAFRLSQQEKLSLLGFALLIVGAAARYFGAPPWVSLGLLALVFLSWGVVNRGLARILSVLFFLGYVVWTLVTVIRSTSP